MSNIFIQGKKNSQKFIARNRAPRVQIEYEVELYGSERKIQIPFVMGVMADLSGGNIDQKNNLSERKFLEIDIDNFDERMKSISPKLSFEVNNTLTNNGLLNIELKFNSLKDFSPDSIAENVAPLKLLLDARTQLSNLLSYMDGKNKAEGLVNMFLNDSELQSLLLENDIKPDEENSETIKEGNNDE